ncbi:hypothetical protein PCASD_09866 [Puccinia coronata f. sp. avenae]|uniref:Uncharacterized protein n=1 Tax=Puccinia coronata f. sp. avenae TaxID=200324 RepID=A0A2N5SAH5_9BASI|nr:hypothetical protein PCASD_21214 [Puccinia coronata f. sp. avenae]PLW38837.1 hypothetical protein PCASD_09866 [Puccinia coronata f. sp. avenae]
MKICTCSKCIINTIRNEDGQTISGKYLSTQNVAKHCSEDQKRSLELKNNTFNQLDDCSDSPPVELPEPSEYSEEIGAFSGLDENEDSLHLFGCTSFAMSAAKTAAQLSPLFSTSSKKYSDGDHQTEAF